MNSISFVFKFNKRRNENRDRKYHFGAKPTMIDMVKNKNAHCYDALGSSYIGHKCY